MLVLFPTRFGHREIALLAQNDKGQWWGPIRVICRNDSADCSKLSRLIPRLGGRLGSMYARVHARTCTTHAAITSGDEPWREMVHDSRAASYDLCRSSRCNLYRVSFYRSGRSYSRPAELLPGQESSSFWDNSSAVTFWVTRGKKNKGRSKRIFRNPSWLDLQF